MLEKSIYHYMKKYVSKDEIIKDYQDDRIGIYDVIKHFDILTSEQNKEGVVYTPGYIAEFMVEKSQPLIENKIVEFCVGHGVFVFALLSYFKKQGHTSVDIKKFIETNLFAHDIVEKSVNEFKEILTSYLKKEFSLDDVIYNNISQKSTLDYINEEIMFDISIGNPPYRRFQNLSDQERLFLQQNFVSCKDGNVDIYFAFLELAKKKSVKSINIIQNSYLKNKSGKKLRLLLKDHVSYIKDFKAVQVFETVGTYTSILMVDNTPHTFFEYEDNSIKQVIENNLLTGDEWNLDNIQQVISMRSKPNVLSQKIDFYSGLATLADGIFILKQEVIDGFISLKIGDKEYQIEEGILKKYVKVSKVKSIADLGKHTYRIIYPYDDKGKILTEEFIQDNFPKAYEYLLANKDLLNKRDKGKVSKYDSWFAYGRKQGFPAKYKGTVLLIPGMVSQQSKYMELQNSEEYLFGSGFFVKPKAGVDMSEILEAFSSSDFLEYVSLTGKIWKGKAGNDYYSPNKKIILTYSY